MNEFIFIINCIVKYKRKLDESIERGWWDIIGLFDRW